MQHTIKTHNLPEQGFARLWHSLKETFKQASEDHSKIISDYILCPLGKIGLKQAEDVDPKKLLYITGAIGALAVAYIIPEQALGLYGLGAAYLSARMPKASETRTAWSLACLFFSAQYMTDIENGYAGLISAGSAAVRGSLLTIINDNDKNFRFKLACGFAAFSALTTLAITGITEQYNNLALLPAYAFAASADYCGNDKSHTMRFWKFGALATVAYYDFMISGNYGSGLASALIFGQTLKTAINQGDFRNEKETHSIKTYLKSLNQQK